jgi:hypothetical protein
MTYHKVDLQGLADALADSIEVARSLEISLTEIVQLIDEGAFVGEQGNRMRSALSDRVIPFTAQVGETCETLVRRIPLQNPD